MGRSWSSSLHRREIDTCRGQDLTAPLTNQWTRGPPSPGSTVVVSLCGVPVMLQTVAVDSVGSVATGADPLSGRTSPEQLGVGVDVQGVGICVHCALHLSSHLKPPPYMAGNSCGFGLRLWVTTKRARSPLRSLSLKETQRNLGVTEKWGSGKRLPHRIYHPSFATRDIKSSIIPHNLLWV